MQRGSAGSGKSIRCRGALQASNRQGAACQTAQGELKICDFTVMAIDYRSQISPTVSSARYVSDGPGQRQPNPRTRHTAANRTNLLFEIKLSRYADYAVRMGTAISALNFDIQVVLS
jgi:hypothetical protein